MDEVVCLLEISYGWSVCFPVAGNFFSICCMIQMQQFSYRYDCKKTLFNGLDLTLPSGKIYGLLGKNGAGKSSLIKNISGLLYPSMGTCTVNGFESRLRQTSFLEQLFFIPEECELPKLSMIQLTAIYAPFYPRFNRLRLKEYMEIFQVSMDSVLHKLSFGQKKKAYIAFALAADTEVLIMDEPTNGLDIPSKVKFRNMVAGAGRKDKLIIMSTHQVRDLDDLINTIVIMDDSKILLYEDKEVLCRRLRFEDSIHANSSHIIYKEQTPNGEIAMCINDQLTSNYLDLEILFNATLQHSEMIGKLFPVNLKTDVCN